MNALQASGALAEHSQRAETTSEQRLSWIHVYDTESRECCVRLRLVYRLNMIWKPTMTVNMENEIKPMQYGQYCRTVFTMCSIICKFKRTCAWA